MIRIKFFMIAAALACTVSTSSYARDTLRAAAWTPPSHQISRYMLDYWAQQLAVHSKGMLKAKVDTGSSMVTPKGAMAELSEGIVDATVHVAQYTPTELALSNALEELGMRYSDPRVIMAATTDFGINSPEMQEEWSRNEIIFGGGYATAPYRLFCNKKIETIADLKGAKLRLTGRAPAAWVNSTGAVTVALNSNEQYGALDKGALTCTATTYADAYNRKLYEVAKHVTDLPVTLFWAGFGWAYNTDTWNELTSEQRKSLFAAEADAMAAYVIKGLGVEEAEALQKIVEQGVTINQPSDDLVASIDGYRDALMDQAVGVATQAFQIKNAEDIFTRFVATVSKWEGLLAQVPEDDEAAYAALLTSEIFDKIDLTTYPLK